MTHDDDIAAAPALRFSPCPSCQHEVLADAARCGRCGHAMHRVWRWLGGAVAVGVGALLVRVLLALPTASGPEAVGGGALLSCGILALALGGILRSRHGALMAAVVATLALAGAAAWATRDPDAAWLADAAALPFVGPTVGDASRWLQSRYSPPATATATATARSAERAAEDEGPLTLFVDGVVPHQPSRPVREARPTSTPETGPGNAVRADGVAGPRLIERMVATLPVLGPGTRRDFLAPVAPEKVTGWTWALPGTPLAESASGRDVIARYTRQLSRLPVVDRQDGWAKVVHDRHELWLDTTWAPPPPTRAQRPKRLIRAQPGDGSRLRTARRILAGDGGGQAEELRAGPYRLYTDIEDPELLRLFDEIATNAENAYLARFGRAPADAVHQAIVAFSREDLYRRYTREELGEEGTERGHAGGGIGALYLGETSSESKVQTVLHELTHLLNRRALSSSLPSWLEEGMATDLGCLWLERVGPLPRGRLQIDGCAAFYRHTAVAIQQGGAPPLYDLFVESASLFEDPATLHVSYGLSAALVGYLLDGENGRHAAAFRDFLAGIARGKDAHPQRILDGIGMTLPELDVAIREHALLLAAEAERRFQR